VQTPNGLLLSKSKYIQDLLHMFHNSHLQICPHSSVVDCIIINGWGIFLVMLVSMKGALQYLAMARPDISHAMMLIA